MSLDGTESIRISKVEPYTLYLATSLRDETDGHGNYHVFLVLSQDKPDSACHHISANNVPWTEAERAAPGFDISRSEWRLDTRHYIEETGAPGYFPARDKNLIVLYEIAKGKAIRVEHVRAMAQEVIGSPDVRDKEVFFNCKACITKTLVSCLGKNVFSLAAEMEEKGSLDRVNKLVKTAEVVAGEYLGELRAKLFRDEVAKTDDMGKKSETTGKTDKKPTNMEVVRARKEKSAQKSYELRIFRYSKSVSRESSFEL